MRQILLVCSKSTRGFFPQLDNIYMVTGAPKKQLLDLIDSHDNVVAIGGGAVIDTAKIISSKPIACYPTTAAGSSCTSHSVCWDGIRKMSIKRQVPKPVQVVSEYVKDLPPKIKEYTTYDVISHCLDSMWSVNRTKESVIHAKEALAILDGKQTNEELIHAGNLGGKAIEICPTTILHSLSYPMTAFYGISHGKALGYLLPRVCDAFKFDLSKHINYNPVIIDNIDWDLIITEALQYDKIYNVEKSITKDFLNNILK